MTNNPNIRFAYMYRDAGNYKQHGEIIFSNETLLQTGEVDQQIRSFLSDGLFFIARQLHVEERFFDVMNADDHPWHEYVGVEESCDPTPETVIRDITEFLSELESVHQAGWDETKVREDLANLFAQQKCTIRKKFESDVNWRLS